MFLLVSVCCGTAQALVFVLVSVCCGTTQVKARAAHTVTLCGCLLRTREGAELPVLRDGARELGQLGQGERKRAERGRHA